MVRYFVFTADSSTPNISFVVAPKKRLAATANFQEKARSHVSMIRTLDSEHPISCASCDLDSPLRFRYSANREKLGLVEGAFFGSIGAPPYFLSHNASVSSIPLGQRSPIIGVVNSWCSFAMLSAV